MALNLYLFSHLPFCSLSLCHDDDYNRNIHTGAITELMIYYKESVARKKD